MQSQTYDNSGHGDLKVPGIPGLPLTDQLPYGQRFAHAVHEWCQRPGISARELAMTDAINRITDEAGWYDHVSDDCCVESWKVAAQQHELINEKAWDWCLAELRDKAASSRRKQFVRVLDTGSCVCKSDELMDHNIAAALKSSLDPLFLHHGASNSSSKSDLVDPYMYPLIYGKTRVLTKCSLEIPRSHHDMESLLNANKCTAVLTRPFIDKGERNYVEGLCQHYMHPGRKLQHRSLQQPKQYFWSSNFQSLPCDLEFTGNETDVRIISYINNLHPRHIRIYSLLERLLGATIGMWNDSLIHGPEDWQTCTRLGGQHQRGGFPLRLPKQTAPLDFCELHMRQVKYRREADAVDEILDDHLNKYLLNHRSSPLPARSPLENWPSITETKSAHIVSAEILKVAEDILDMSFVHKEPDDSLDGIWDKLEDEVAQRIHWRQPEPGETLSFASWRSGHTDSSSQYSTLAWRQQSVQLEKSFHKEGLQVIVRIGEVRLTPGERYEKDWQLGGLLNEHIVASAIYAYDVHNIDCSILFSQETPDPFNNYKCRDGAGRSDQQELPDWLGDFESLADLIAREELRPCSDGKGDIDIMQDIGLIRMPQNRLITFPNTVEHCIQAKTIDDAQPGHMKSITLHLVDPHYRIISTRNVPPQQSTWWKTIVARCLLTKLPVELVDQILEYYDHPLSDEEAEKVRLQMIREHQWFELARHAKVP